MATADWGAASGTAFRRGFGRQTFCAAASAVCALMSASLLVAWDCWRSGSGFWCVSQSDCGVDGAVGSAAAARCRSEELTRGC